MKRMVSEGSILFSILFLAVVILLGCATGTPINNPQISESNLPSRHYIVDVPLYRQGYMDCGPTSLRMVMNYYGKNYSEEEITKARRGRGTTLADAESYARSQGFGVYTIYDWTKSKMKYLIAQGYPLIVAGEITPNWLYGRAIGEGHWTVVVGYDDIEKTFSINEPGIGRRQKKSYQEFKEFHSALHIPANSNYVLCIYPKQK
jgi:ABC-type bacteriocin/lantibiotic exporter with double-glycine peptidase domain